MSADRILRSAAIKAAQKRLPILSDRKLEESLALAVGTSVAEAYRIGAEEAQFAITTRLRELKCLPENPDA